MHVASSMQLTSGRAEVHLAGARGRRFAPVPSGPSLELASLARASPLAPFRSALGVSRRNVQVERPQRRSARVPDFVAIATFDEDQAPGAQSMPPAVDKGDAASGFDEHPLIRAAVAVIGSAFRVTWCDRHRCGLAASVANRHAKAIPEAQMRVLHVRTPSEIREPRSH